MHETGDGCHLRRLDAWLAQETARSGLLEMSICIGSDSEVCEEEVALRMIDYAKAR